MIDSDTFKLTMLGSNAATPDWTGVTRLNAFQIKGVGSFASATATGPGSFLKVDKELNGNGCAGGSGGALNLCFEGSTAVASSLSWTIDVTGGSLDVDSRGPDLKVRFGNGQNDKVGNLISAHLPPVPELETYAFDARWPWPCRRHCSQTESQSAVIFITGFQAAGSASPTLCLQHRIICSG